MSKTLFFIFITFFFFSNLFSFGQSTTTNNISSDKLTDKEWLRKVRLFGLSDEDVISKLPILQSEIDLTQEQTDEIEKLITLMADEEATADGLQNDEEKVVKLRGNEKNTRININNDHEIELRKKEIDVMNEVAKVRDMLGIKDLDFRLWLIEEDNIYCSVGLEYSKNRNISPDELVKSVINRVQESNIFNVCPRRSKSVTVGGPKV